MATVSESTDSRAFPSLQRVLLGRAARTVLQHQSCNHSVTSCILFWLPLKTSSNDQCLPLPPNHNTVANLRWPAIGQVGSLSSIANRQHPSQRACWSLCPPSGIYYPRYTRRRCTPEYNSYEQSTDGRGVMKWVGQGPKPSKWWRLDLGRDVFPSSLTNL